MQAFKGPLDQGRNGNFGLDEGFNFGSALWPAARLGYQLGVEAVQSDLSGETVVGTECLPSRQQVFTTVGIFQRAIACDPWQWGVAWDYLSDHYYVNTQYSRVRARVQLCRLERSRARLLD